MQAPPWGVLLLAQAPLGTTLVRPHQGAASHTAREVEVPSRRGLQWL